MAKTKDFKRTKAGNLKRVAGKGQGNPSRVIEKKPGFEDDLKRQDSPKRTLGKKKTTRRKKGKSARTGSRALKGRMSNRKGILLSGKEVKPGVKSKH